MKHAPTPFPHRKAPENIELPVPPFGYHMPVFPRLEPMWEATQTLVRMKPLRANVPALVDHAYPEYGHPFLEKQLAWRTETHMNREY